jgi:hypothetical protein
LSSLLFDDTRLMTGPMTGRPQWTVARLLASRVERLRQSSLDLRITRTQRCGDPSVDWRLGAHVQALDAVEALDRRKFAPRLMSGGHGDAASRQLPRGSRLRHGT